MNYYLIITSEVLQAKISSNSKLLYAMISGLTNEKGYCYASNKYFSEKLNITERQTQNLIKELKEYNFIKINIFDNNQRIIFLNSNPKEDKINHLEIIEELLKNKK